MEPPHRRRRRGPLQVAQSGLTVAAVSAVLGWWAMLPAAAETVEFTITDSRITESSGLATDAANQRYWTVNDSGDEGVAYALDGDGEDDGTLGFRVEPVDVEAVAFHEGRLYVADIGDNRERREFVTVYFFDDAEPADQPVVYKAYDFSYPDGPHDAETLLVDGDGRLLVVTKGADGGIYAAPRSPSRQGVNSLERVADAPSYVTDGTVLPDGKLALRTYVSVEIVDPTTYQVTARASTPAQQQGESITTALDGDALLIGSEGKRSTVLRIDIPTSMGDVPKPPAEPPSTTSAKPSAPTPSTAPRDSGSPAAGDEPADDGRDSNASGTSRAGTLAALGIAAVVAVAAAAVVVFARRP